MLWNPSLHRLATVLAVALCSMSLPAAELALSSAEGLELINVVATPDALDGRQGLKLVGDPEVLQAAAAKRQKMLADMRAPRREAVWARHV